MTGDLYTRARGLLPGGVSSPARAFGAVGGDPIFAAWGEGAMLYDTEGRGYIDYIQGFGSVILGHAHPVVVEATAKAAERGGAVGLSTAAEVDLAGRIVEAVPGIERVRFMTSGTEASMTAARLVRAATGRDVIVKFEGNYHGHADAFLAKAGSGVATYSVPAAVGVPRASVADTITLPYNDAAALKEAFASNGDRIAGVFVEPVAGNMGVVEPEAGFLDGLIDAAHSAGALVVFDEVITGFRVGRSGAQGSFGLQPDLTMFGKVVGGGLPVGVVGGPADLMDRLLPAGEVYQAGTFAAHPHAMAAGNAVLEAVGPGAYTQLTATAARLADGLAAVVTEVGAPVRVVRHATMLCVHFTPAVPRDYRDVSACDRDGFAGFHRRMREAGVLLPPSPFEVWFPSLAHGPTEIEQTISAARSALTS